jgi:hypothetical protein
MARAFDYRIATYIRVEPVKGACHGASAFLDAI